MKYRFAIPLFLAAFLLQTTAMNHWKLFGVGPNLVLCSVIVLALFYSGWSGAVLGIVFGLLQDVCFSTIVGPSGLAYFIVFLLIRYFRNVFYRDSIFSVFCITAIGTVSGLLLDWGIVAVFSEVYSIISALELLPVLLGYNFAAVLIFYFVCGRRILRKNPGDVSYMRYWI